MRTSAAGPLLKVREMNATRYINGPDHLWTTQHRELRQQEETDVKLQESIAQFDVPRTRGRQGTESSLEE